MSYSSHYILGHSCSINLALILVTISLYLISQEKEDLSGLGEEEIPIVRVGPLNLEGQSKQAGHPA
jgi:hypothetical protein